MAGTPGVKPAVKAVTYRNTGTYSSPTWTPITAIRDVNLGRAWELADAFSRVSRVKMYGATLMEMAVSMKVRCDDVDAGYLALDAVAVSAAVLELLILDGPLTAEGAKGVRAFWQVSDTGQDQAIEGNLFKEYEVKPGYGYNSGTLVTPKAVVVGASSALTETDPG